MAKLTSAQIAHNREVAARAADAAAMCPNAFTPTRVNPAEVKGRKLMGVANTSRVVRTVK